MSKKNKFQKELVEIAEKLGLEDKAMITGQIKPGTKEEPFFILVNNQRRFVKGLLKLPLEEQESRIRQLRGIIAEQELADANKVQG